MSLVQSQQDPPIYRQHQPAYTVFVGIAESVETLPKIYALVAQLDRVPGYEPGGRGFESSSVHQITRRVAQLVELSTDNRAVSGSNPLATTNL